MDRLAVDVREAAQALGLSASTVYEKARRQELRTIRVGRRLLVPVEELRRLVAASPERPRER